MSKEEYVKASIELAGNVAHLRWILGTDIDESDARAAMAALATVCAHHNYPLLIHLDDMRWASKAVLGVFAGDWPVSRIAILGTTPVDYVFWLFYLSRHSPFVPTRFFTSLADAEHWLTSYP